MMEWKQTVFVFSLRNAVSTRSIVIRFFRTNSKTYKTKFSSAVHWLSLKENQFVRKSLDTLHSWYSKRTVNWNYLKEIRGLKIQMKNFCWTFIEIEKCYNSLENEWFFVKKRLKLLGIHFRLLGGRWRDSSRRTDAIAQVKFFDFKIWTV